jgi:uncharacterized small protein (DUF1192 family)
MADYENNITVLKQEIERLTLILKQKSELEGRSTYLVQ